jgi:hypothetical protein
MKTRCWKVFGLLLVALLAAGPARAGVEVKGDGFFIDGKYFYPVGVNYMPKDSAVYLWKEFDPEKINREFALISDMGLNTVRTFVFWEDLNPEPGKISQDNLAQVGKLLDLAEKNNLKVVLTLNTGHMSGENWYPEWMGQGRETEAVMAAEPVRMFQLHPPRKSRSIYEDQLAQENALLQAGALARKFRDHPALLYYDLGNENQYWQRPKSPELAQRYVANMVAEIKKTDPGHPVAIGMGKFAEQTGFQSYGKFGVNRFEDLYIVHTYPAGYYPATQKPVDQFTTYYPGFEVSLSRATGLPVQFQEFGMSATDLAAMPPKERELRLGGYYRNGLWGALMAGANSGALGWCFADFSSRLASKRPYNTHPYELHFGAVNQDYGLNPSGQELKNFAALIKSMGDQPLFPAFDPVAIVIPENYMEFPAENKLKGPGTRFDDTHANHNRFLFSAYLALRQSGINPEFVRTDSDFSGLKLLVVPNFSDLSDKLVKRLNQALDEGTAVYIAGNIPSRDLHIPIVVRELVEVETALKPDNINLAKLRGLYSGLLAKAQVRPAAFSSEPFVELGFVSGKYLVAVNHLDKAVTTRITFSREVKISNCRSTHSQAPKDNMMEMALGAFGVEVCEAEFSN